VAVGISERWGNLPQFEVQPMSVSLSGLSFRVPFPTRGDDGIGKAAMVAHFADLCDSSETPARLPRAELEASSRGPPPVSTSASWKKHCNPIHHKEQELL
jgi:hypothetical protein